MTTLLISSDYFTFHDVTVKDSWPVKTNLLISNNLSTFSHVVSNFFIMDRIETAKAFMDIILPAMDRSSFDGHYRMISRLTLGKRSRIWLPWSPMNSFSWLWVFQHIMFVVWEKVTGKSYNLNGKYVLSLTSSVVKDTIKVQVTIPEGNSFKLTIKSFI